MWYDRLMKHLMTYRMAMFAIASFLPIPLIALAAVFGGWWVVFALSYIPVFKIGRASCRERVASPV